MSELRIALVAEGPTDYEIIQAALKAILPHPFVLVQIQPEATQPLLGAGWGGVLKWCHAASQRHRGVLEVDPTLVGFDLLIIHLDVDVAGEHYAHLGAALDAMVTQRQWGSLPCAQPCPPIADTVTRLAAVVVSWLGEATPGERTVFCLPAQASGTWLATAVLAPANPLLAGGECDAAVEAGLERLPLNQRIKKTQRTYRLFAPQLTAHWESVKQACTQAQQFEQRVVAATTGLTTGDATRTDGDQR